MPHTLLTFLGRTARSANGYPTTAYQFPDGHESDQTAILGWYLAKWRRPERVVVLGTSGSMWDFLAEDAGIAEQPELVRIWERLEQAVNNQIVTPELLGEIEPLVQQHTGIETRLHLIPKGLDEIEQLEILQVIATATEGATELTLDVSHAFRHLPMIAVIASVYLQAVRNIRLRELWYGFYDPDTKTGTAHDLRGLLHLIDWVRSLSQFEHTGDYGVFTDLFVTTGRPEEAELMRKAAFFERTNRESLAKQPLDTIVQHIQERPLIGVPGLFQPALEDRLKWARETTPQERQRQLARDYLERRDYMRAVIYSQEALITDLVYQNKGDHTSYDQRSEAETKYRENAPDLYWRMINVRNALVHGTRPTGIAERLMKDEKQLRQHIEEFLKIRPKP